MAYMFKGEIPAEREVHQRVLHAAKFLRVEADQLLISGKG